MQLKNTLFHFSFTDVVREATLFHGWTANYTLPAQISPDNRDLFDYIQLPSKIDDCFIGLQFTRLLLATLLIALYGGFAILFIRV